MFGSLASFVYNYIALMDENTPGVMTGENWGLKAFLLQYSALVNT